MAGKVLEIGQDQFEEVVKQSAVPVLVDFWAPWCGPCRALAPVLEQVADELDGKATIVKINTDDNQELAQSFNIMSIPTMLIYSGGEAKDQIQGARPKDAILQTLQKHIGE